MQDTGICCDVPEDTVQAMMLATTVYALFSPNLVIICMGD